MKKYLILLLIILGIFCLNNLFPQRFVQASSESSKVGDFDDDGMVNTNDVIYLLMHTYFKEEYPVTQNCDFDNDGLINTSDVIYLLMHTYFPNEYPLISTYKITILDEKLNILEVTRAEVNSSLSKVNLNLEKYIPSGYTWNGMVKYAFGDQEYKNAYLEDLELIDNLMLIPLFEKTEFEITFNLDGGVFTTGFTNIEELTNAFLADYNAVAGSPATISNFLGDTKDSVKTALSNKALLTKWQWLFQYMYDDLVAYNTKQGTMKVSYVSDALDLLVKLIDLDTTVIKDGTKGPNFRTLVRSYLHGVMNKSKGSESGNSVFAKYVPDFSLEEVQNGLLTSQFDKTIKIKNGEELPIPIKEYYVFKGWQDLSGNIVTKATSDMSIIALWEEGVGVEKIEITNKITELEVFKTHQLSWKITPSDAVNKKVKFTSSDSAVASIDENGLITAHATGTVTIKIISSAKSGKTDEFTLSVVTPGYFEISYETNSYVTINDVIKLNAVYYNDVNQKNTITWESLNPDIALVDEEGYVTGLEKGVAFIRARVTNRQTIYQDFMVTVVDKEISDALKVVLNAHESNVYIEYNLGIGAGTPVYYTDIIGSVSKLLFSDELVINNTYSKATEDKYGSELKNRLLESVEFITVHYTGSMNSGDTAEAIAKYFAKPLSSVATSIHYTTGNDGVFRGMNEIYRAAHAGDDGSLDTVTKFEWRDTPVLVLPTDPEFPVVTITKNSTFAINGRDTEIKIPYETKRGRGYVTDNKWLNEMGLAVNIKDGKYQLGTAWWCYTQVWEGRICSNGGNRNSIGIESCVNRGSDLWYTWQKTAQLTADIMLRHNLDITRVKGHHFYSAKNCPQPMLENELRLWWEFIDLVKAEYEKLTKTKDCTFTFTSESEFVNNKGRVLKQALEAELITYTVTINNGTKTEVIELASIIEGAYNK